MHVACYIYKWHKNNLYLDSNHPTIRQSCLVNLTNGRCSKGHWVKRTEFIFPIRSKVFHKYFL